MLLAKLGEKIIVGPERLRFCMQADTAGDTPQTITVVERGGEQARVQAPFAVVMAGLQEQGTLACIHRREVEVKLGHSKNSRGEWWVRLKNLSGTL